jgi:hypothetical protein
MSIRPLVLLATLAAAYGLRPLASAQTSTSFTFQGQLQSSGAPANGTYDIRCSLFDAAIAGNQRGPTVCLDNVPVNNGLVTVTLDFGAQFPGAARWLELGVRPDTTAGNCSTGVVTLLSPRQPLNPTPYAAGLTLPQFQTINTPGAAFTLINSGGDAFNGYATGTGRSGVYGVNSQADGYGVFGRNTASGTYGALGQGYAGVFGGNDTDGGRGGWFADSTPTGTGVLGQANSTTGLCYGVSGVSNSSAGVGVLGRTLAGAGSVGGVMGVAYGLNGNGVLGKCDNGPLAVGVVGASQTGWGIQGVTTAATGTNYGVFGQAASPTGAGVYGFNSAGAGIWGESDSYTAVVGISSTGTGVYGQSDSTDGVTGQSMGSGTSGVYGYTNISLGFGVSGRNWTAGTNGALASNNAGVYGLAYSGAAATYGVYGENSGTTGYAGYFLGRGYFSDNVGIGVLQPSVPLQVAGGSDLTLTDGGNIVVGQINSANLVLDNNEIQARNNGATAALFINANGGNVGIGTGNAQGFQLAVNGTAAKPGGGSWSNFSDARLKKDIQPLTGALDTLLSLRGVTFEYIDPKAINELPGTRTGMIAQDVEKVVPDWVDEGQDGMKRVTYRGFEALTVEALRDLRTESDAAHEADQARIAALEQENRHLRQDLADLRAAVEALAAHQGTSK